jgi:hypothetical protein
MEETTEVEVTGTEPMADMEVTGTEEVATETAE